MLGAIGLAIDTKVGVFTWSVGLLLAVNQIRTEARSETNFAQLTKLATVLDLSQGCDVEQLRQLIDAYSKIPEPEFQRVKDSLVASARTELLHLANEKTSRDLFSGEYYRWLLPMLDESRPPETIRALSLMMKCEWDDSPSESRFIECSRRASERGVETHRIFVMPIGLLTQALTIPAVRAHTIEEGPPLLIGHLVDLDWLKQNDDRLAKRLGDGFIAFEQRVALIDLHSMDGSARGRVTMSTASIAELIQLHSELLVHSRRLALALTS